MLVDSKFWMLSVCFSALIFIGCESEKKSEVASDKNQSEQIDDNEQSNTESKSGVSAETTAKKTKPAGYQFAAPIRLKGGDDFVSVESPGYACPTLADVDGDGKEDLVVGQFTNGHMQFLKNISSGSEPPKFASADWIKTGEERAQVPGVW